MKIIKEKNNCNLDGKKYLNIFLNNLYETNPINSVMNGYSMTLYDKVQKLSEENNLNENIDKFSQKFSIKNEKENFNFNYSYIFLGKFNFEKNINSFIKFEIYYKKNPFNKIIDFMLKQNDQNIIDENENKRKMFSKMAHEFKTPLNSIIGLIKKMKNRKNIIGDSQISKINQINTNILDMNRLYLKKVEKNNKNLKLIKGLSNYSIYLINDLIQYFSSNSSKKEIKFKKDFIKLKKIINFCFDILNSLISCNQKKSDFVKTELLLDKKLENFFIHTDEVRLNQILLNFISNAVKFTKSGYIRLIVELIESETDKSEILISIEDNGMGIKDEDKIFIFNPGLNEENIENNININYEHNKMGTGLGLSISYNIANALSHKIFFSSIYTKGSKFSVGIISDLTKNNINGEAYNTTNISSKSYNQSKLFSQEKIISDKNFVRKENNLNRNSLKDNKTLKFSKFVNCDKSHNDVIISDNNSSSFTNSPSNIRFINKKNNIFFNKFKKIKSKSNREKIESYENKINKYFLCNPENLKKKLNTFDSKIIINLPNSSIDSDKITVKNNKTFRSPFNKVFTYNLSPDYVFRNIPITNYKSFSEKREGIKNNSLIEIRKNIFGEEESSISYKLKEYNTNDENLIERIEDNSITLESKITKIQNTNFYINYNLNNIKDGNFFNYINSNPPNIKNIDISNNNFINLGASTICNLDSPSKKDLDLSDLISDKTDKMKIQTGKYLRKNCKENSKLKHDINNVSSPYSIIHRSEKKIDSEILSLKNFEEYLEKNKSKENFSNSNYHNCGRYFENLFLIVDDNKHIRKAIKNNLIKALNILNNNLSYKIIEGFDGVDIIKFIIEDQIENKIRCVFTDENMEYLNGSEAVKILTDLEKRKKIKKYIYVSVTSYEDEYASENILKSGIDLIIAKPVTKNNIVNFLKDLHIFKN